MMRLIFILPLLIAHLGLHAQYDSLSIAQHLVSKATDTSLDTVSREKLFQQALRIGERHNYTSFLADTRTKFADFLFEHTYYHRALGSYSHARQYYQTLGDTINLGWTAYKIALTQNHRGNFRFATREFLNALELADKYNIEALKDAASEDIGLLYNGVQRYSDAVQSYKKSMMLKKKLHDEIGYYRVALKLCETYNDMEKLDSSILLAQTILKAPEKKEFKYDKLNAHLYYAMGLLRQLRIREAEPSIKFLKQYIENETSEVKQKKQGDYTIKFKTYTLIGNYYLIDNNPKEAQAWYDQTLKYLSAGNYPESYAYHYKMVSEAYNAKGDLGNANKYLQMQLNSMKQLVTGQSLSDLKSITNVYEKKENEDEVKWLNAENKLKQLQILRGIEKAEQLLLENKWKDSILKSQKDLAEALTSSNNYQSRQLEQEKQLQLNQSQKLKSIQRERSMLLLFSLFSLFLTGVIYAQYKRQTTKNQIIKQQSDELHNLMKEIHHRVKNNLQVVSSMLNLQSKYINDKEALEAVKESKNRVLSMSLIHQRLYQEGDFRSVNVKDYVDNLVQNLMSSYNIAENTIIIYKDVENMSLDEDTVMPLGLILNELLTNCLKYAFPQGSGKINIWLKNIDHKLMLKVKDNGIGMGHEDDKKSTNTFGHKMIQSFLQKLKGTMKIENNEGTEVTITIPKN